MNPNFSPIEGTPPVWAGDFSSRESVVPAGAKLDASQFIAVDGVVVVVDTAGAAADATSVPVKALTGPIPAGTLLDFGAKKFARVNTLAPAGAVNLVVDNIPTALASTNSATYKGVGKKSIPSGTAIGRTISERDAGANYGPAIDTDDEIYLTVREIYDLDNYNETELYRHHRIVKENFLPGISTMASALKIKLRSLYTCIKGAN